MGTDYGEKERQFLESLEAETGRDLAGWMAAIAEANLSRRNDIIDWLRRQGFVFSKASWLERIHHNGGKAIYAARAERRAPARRRREASPAVERAPTAETTGTIIPFRPRQEASPPPAPAAVSAEAQEAYDRLAAIIASAKAFRPLATFLLAEIRKAVPKATFAVEGSHIVIAAPGEFAVVAISPRELRLGIVLPGAPLTPPFQAAKFPGAASRIPPGVTHMVVLTDARQVDYVLLTRLREAAATVA